MPTKITTTKDAAPAEKSTRPAAVKPQTSDGSLAAPGEMAISNPGAAGPAQILDLQRKVGNRAVQRLLARHAVQAKLTVGPAGDAYEQEADRVADQVLSQPAPPAEANINRQEEEEVQMKPAQTVTPLAQREPGQPGSLAGSFEAGDALEREIEANRGGGQPLPADLRGDMEHRFGADFSAVRLHTGSAAAPLNQKIGARAFTLNQDIFMGAGEYNPGSSAGRHLLAHELTHTIQQGGPARRHIIRRGFFDWFKKKPKNTAPTPPPTPTTSETPTPTSETPTPTEAPSPEKIQTSLQNVKDMLDAWEKAKDSPDLSARASALAAMKKAITDHEKLDPTETSLPGWKSAAAEQERYLQIVTRIHDKYGVTLHQQAGVDAIKASYTSVPEEVLNKLSVTPWSWEQLEDVEAALSRYAGLLGPERIKKKLGAQGVTTFSRLKQAIDEDTPQGNLDTSTFGETFDSNISMFDAAKNVTDFATDKSAPTDEEKRMGFRGTIEHELSHALIEDVTVKGGKKAGLDQFVSDMPFWRDVYDSRYWKDADYGDTGYSAVKTREAAKKAKVEAPITNYGMKSAKEDLAEAMMFFFESPDKLKSDCPKRYAFINKRIAPLLAPTPEKKKK